jgi:hypothetical protein
MIWNPMKKSANEFGETPSSPWTPSNPAVLRRIDAGPEKAIS